MGQCAAFMGKNDYRASKNNGRQERKKAVCQIDDEEQDQKHGQEFNGGRASQPGKTAPELISKMSPDEP
jgi:hypothetical protein